MTTTPSLSMFPGGIIMSQPLSSQLLLDSYPLPGYLAVLQSIGD